MPLDLYALCPGGTGKRLKFCCKDLVGELEQLDRMLQGDQHLAALQKIEVLEKAHPDRACLMEIKAQLLRALEKFDELEALVPRFVALHPTNAVALSERAMVVAENESGLAGMNALQDAVEACTEGFPSRVYDAIAYVAAALLDDGQIIAARALYFLQSVVRRDAAEPVETIMRLNASPQIPLLLKDDSTLHPRPDDAPWAADFDAAMQAVARGQWRKAAAVFEQLAQREPNSPLLWRNLATLRSWLGDSAAAAAALAHYAGLDVPTEDAADARAIAMLMSPDPLGDNVDALAITYPLGDVDEALHALAAAGDVVMQPVDPATVQAEGPPPKSYCVFLDRAKLPDNTLDLTDQNVPHVLAQGLLYGRETDKGARLELPALTAPRWEQLRPRLEQIVPPGGPVETRVVGQLSRTRDVIRADWYLPRGVAPELLTDFLKKMQTAAILEGWTQLPLGALGGQSAGQAAADSAQRIALLAVIRVLESWWETGNEPFDGNLLRAKLELPQLGPIDPQTVPFAEMPLGRLHRLEVEKLADQSLLIVYHRAVAFQVHDALLRLSQELVSRKELKAESEKANAYRYLVEIEPDSQRVLELIEEGRKITEAAGKSNVSWDFLEINIRLARQEVQEFGRLVQHIRAQHAQEPGVSEALFQLLVELGLLRPDGTPTATMRRPVTDPLLTPGGSAPEPGKIWTPESETGGSGGGRLWTPD